MRQIPVLVLAVLLCSFSAFADIRLKSDRIDGAKGILLWGDFNADGLDDVLNENRLQFNLGGRLAPAIEVAPFAPSASTHPQAVANFNNDAYADVVVRYERGQDVVFLGNGSGSFTGKPVPGDLGAVMETFDFSGDGLADLLTWKPGQITLLRGLGDGTFAAHQTFPWAGSYVHRDGPPPAADVNGDGRLDFVMATESALIFYLARADGTFIARERFLRFDPWHVQFGDLNGDGKLDIGMASAPQGQLSITALYGDGTGRFPHFAIEAPRAGWPDQMSARNIVIGDFVPGGAQELAYGTGDGWTVVLSGAGNRLTEVGRVQVEGRGLRVLAMRFRSSTPDLVTIGHIRYSANLAAWVLAAEGSIAAEQGSARTHASTHLRIGTADGGTYGVHIESACPIPGFTGFTFQREGLFVDFATSEKIPAARAMYLPGELYVELQVKDGSATRTLTGTLLATDEGLKGKLFEWDPSSCGRWQAHRVTAIPTL